jgi:hydrogenase maturation protease
MAGETLLIGYGNPGRLDDGLGPCFIRALEERNPAGAALDCNYQLSVEDAELISKYRRVVFVDAGSACAEPFELKRIEAEAGFLGFSSHTLSPQALLGLAGEMFQARPEAWLLAIRGYDFNEFGERLSSRAEQNLGAALEHMERWLLEWPPAVAQPSEMSKG